MKSIFDDLRNGQISEFTSNLAQFVLGSCLSVDSPDTQLQFGVSDSYKGTCVEAEDNFSLLIEQLLARHRYYKDEDEATVTFYCYVDNQPIAIQKHIGDNTAILLKTCKVNGVIVPAGTIVDIRQLKFMPTLKKRIPVSGVSNGFNVVTHQVSSDSDIAISPLRLSPWLEGWNSDRSSLFGVVPTTKNPTETILNIERANTCSWLSLPIIRDVASNVLIETSDV